MNYNQPFRGAQNTAVKPPDPRPPDEPPHEQPDEPPAKRQPTRQAAQQRPKQAPTQRRAKASDLKFAPLECIDLSQRLRTNKQWLADRLMQDPSQLGLGDLTLVDHQRAQQTGASLGLLLTDGNEARATRYALDVQLGAADPDQLVRAIERWSHERQQHPNHEHVAVIVAEHVSSRLLEVMRLMSDSIPLTVLQATAVKVADDTATLVFTRLLGSQQASPDAAIDDDVALASPRDRAFWESRVSPRSLTFLDELLALIRSLDGEVQPHYAKEYIGLARRGRTHHYVKLTPNSAARQALVVVRLPYSAEQQQMLESAGVEVNGYYESTKSYNLTVSHKTLGDAHQRQAFENLLRAASAHWLDTMPPARPA